LVFKIAGLEPVRYNKRSDPTGATLRFSGPMERPTGPETLLRCDIQGRALCVASSIERKVLRKLLTEKW